MNKDLYIKRKDTINMEYKFDAEKVTVEELAKFANETWGNDSSAKLVMLRDPKRDELGLFIVLELENDDKELHREKQDEIRDKLYKNFGIALKGWAGSNRTFVIKGLEELRN